MEIDHDLLDRFHVGVAVATGSGWPDPARTGLVLVIVAPAVAVPAVAQSYAADAAVERAFKVVAVVFRSLPRKAMAA